MTKMHSSFEFAIFCFVALLPSSALGKISYSLVHNNSTFNFVDYLRVTTDDKQDFFYTILGHPHDHSATKRQFDCFSMVNDLLVKHGYPSKSVTLNMDMAMPRKSKRSPKPDRDELRIKYDPNKNGIDLSQTETEFDESEEKAAPEGHTPAKQEEDFPEDEEEEKSMLHSEHKQQESYFGNSEWIADYGRDKLKLHYKEPQDIEREHFETLGVTAIVWKDCIKSNLYTSCLRILQVRNHDRLYPHNTTASDLQPVFSWMKYQLKQRAKETILIVMQDFDEQLPPVVESIAKIIGKQRILGVFFAMMIRDGHTQRKNLCQKFKSAGIAKIPVIAFTEIDPEDVMIIQYNLRYASATRHIYAATALTQFKVHMKEIDFATRDCL